MRDVLGGEGPAVGWLLDAWRDGRIRDPGRSRPSCRTRSRRSSAWPSRRPVAGPNGRPQHVGPYNGPLDLYPRRGDTFVLLTPMGVRLRDAAAPSFLAHPFNPLAGQLLDIDLDGMQLTFQPLAPARRSGSAREDAWLRRGTSSPRRFRLPAYLGIRRSNVLRQRGLRSGRVQRQGAIVRTVLFGRVRIGRRRAARAVRRRGRASALATIRRAARHRAMQLRLDRSHTSTVRRPGCPIHHLGDRDSACSGRCPMRRSNSLYSHSCAGTNTATVPPGRSRRAISASNANIISDVFEHVHQNCGVERVELVAVAGVAADDVDAIFSLEA